MPLPAALLAKLKQRGIVEEQKSKEEILSSQLIYTLLKIFLILEVEDEEEVFAENYDESDDSDSSV